MHEIRIASLDEADAVQDFIRRYWKADHIFVKSKDLLLWQHASRTTTRALNFVIAKDAASGSIDAINGFIGTGHFDAGLSSNRDFWLAIWKRREDVPDVMLGIRLFYFINTTFTPRSIGVIGLSEIAVKIYARLGFKMGRLHHHFILNRTIANPAIALDKGFKFSPPHPPSRYTVGEITGAGLDAMEAIAPGDWAPQKSIEFLRNRYVRHPVYQYKFFAVREGDVPRCLLVVRKIHAQGSCCLRIVDVYGGAFEKLDSIQSELSALVERDQAEYVDCYNHGIDPEVFLRLGFEERNDQMIIPNYFEPFSRTNVELAFAFKSDGRYVMFKGDGDQDRPNVLPEA